jgi:hypothetical protein
LARAVSSAAREPSSALPLMNCCAARRSLLRALGLHEGRAGRFQQRAALGHAAAQFGQLDLPQRLAGAHAAALGHRQGQQRAAGLGAHGGGLWCHQRARELHDRGHAGQRGPHDLAAGELQRHLGPGAIAGPGLRRGGRRRIALAGRHRDQRGRTAQHHHRRDDAAGYPLLLHRVPLG